MCLFLDVKNIYICFFLNSSMDNKVMIWDIRSAKACLMTLDQHNGKPCSNTEQGKMIYNVQSGQSGLI